MPSTLHNNIGNDNEKFVMPLKRKNGQTNQVMNNHPTSNSTLHPRVSLKTLLHHKMSVRSSVSAL